MEKESWLDPITDEDLRKFASQQSLKGNYNNEICYCKQYGKIGVIDFVSARGSGHHYFTPFAFSTIFPNESSYLDRGEQGYDLLVMRDMIETRIFAGCVFKSLSEQTAMLWNNWIGFVDQKNKGRKINGLTFMEELKSKINQYFEYKKEEEHKRIDAQIDCYEADLINMCPNIVSKEQKNENSEYDFSDICTNNTNSDKTDIRNK